MLGIGNNNVAIYHLLVLRARQEKNTTSVETGRVPKGVRTAAQGSSVMPDTGKAGARPLQGNSTFVETIRLRVAQRLEMKGKAESGTSKDSDRMCFLADVKAMMKELMEEGRKATDSAERTLISGPILQALSNVEKLRQLGTKDVADALTAIRQDLLASIQSSLVKANSALTSSLDAKIREIDAFIKDGTAALHANTKALQESSAETRLANETRKQLRADLDNMEDVSIGSMFTDSWMTDQQLAPKLASPIPKHGSLESRSKGHTQSVRPKPNSQDPDLSLTSQSNSISHSKQHTQSDSPSLSSQDPDLSLTSQSTSTSHSKQHVRSGHPSLNPQYPDISRLNSPSDSDSVSNATTKSEESASSSDVRSRSMSLPKIFTTSFWRGNMQKPTQPPRQRAGSEGSSAFPTLNMPAFKSNSGGSNGKGDGGEGEAELVEWERAQRAKWLAKSNAGGKTLKYY